MESENGSQYSKFINPIGDIECERGLLRVYGIYPIFVVTAICNIFVLHVWNCENEFHTTTYLFKMLCITDLFNAFGLLIYLQIPENTRLAQVMRFYHHGHQRTNVYVGVLLALVRLFKILPSTVHMEHYFTRRRLKIILSCIVFWTLSLGVLSGPVRGRTCIPFLEEQEYNRTAGDLVTIETVLIDHVGLSIPAALQLVIMAVVMWYVHKYKHLKHGENPEHANVMRRLDGTVFLICFFTFITHFVMRVVISWAKTSMHRDYHYRVTIPTYMLTGINGLVNVVFYSIFVPRFRQLAKNEFVSWNEMMEVGVSSLAHKDRPTSLDRQVPRKVTLRQSPQQNSVAPIPDETVRKSTSGRLKNLTIDTQTSSSVNH